MSDDPTNGGGGDRVEEVVRAEVSVSGSPASRCCRIIRCSPAVRAFALVPRRPGPSRPDLPVLAPPPRAWFAFWLGTSRRDVWRRGGDPAAGHLVLGGHGGGVIWL